MSFPTDESAHYPKFSEVHNYPNPYKNVGQRVKIKNPPKEYKEPKQPKKIKDRPKTHQHHHHKYKVKVPNQNIKAPKHQYVAVPIGPPVYVPVAVKTGYIPVYNQPQQPMYTPPPPVPQYGYYPPPPPPQYYPPNPGKNYVVIPPGYGEYDPFNSVV